MADKNLMAGTGKLTVTGQPAGLIVKRGSESWNYLRGLFPYFVAVEGGVVSMIEPLPWAWKIIAFVGFIPVAWFSLFRCGWVQNQLIGFKNKTEAWEWKR